MYDDKNQGEVTLSQCSRRGYSVAVFKWNSEFSYHWRLYLTQGSRTYLLYSKVKNTVDDSGKKSAFQTCKQNLGKQVLSQVVTKLMKWWYLEVHLDIGNTILVVSLWLRHWQQVQSQGAIPYCKTLPVHIPEEDYSIFTLSVGRRRCHVSLPFILTP